MSESEFESRRLNRLKTVALTILVCYWLAMFTGTHIPRPEHDILLGASDKLAHFSAYAGLSFLCCLNWSLRRVLAWRQWLVIVALLAGFGIFDELTQIPVGRDCDILDWCADLTGIVCGIAAFQAAVFLRRRPQWGLRRA